MQAGQPINAVYKCASCGHLSMVDLGLCPSCRNARLSLSRRAEDIARMTAISEVGQRQLMRWILLFVVGIAIMLSLFAVYLTLSLAR